MRPSSQALFTLSASPWIQLMLDLLELAEVKVHPSTGVDPYVIVFAMQLSRNVHVSLVLVNNSSVLPNNWSEQNVCLHMGVS